MATAIAAGLADTGITSEPAALASGLVFVPLASQRADLAIPPGIAGSPEVRGLRMVLSHRGGCITTVSAQVTGEDCG